MSSLSRRSPDEPADITVASDPAPSVFSGPGEMAARSRAFDWAATPLGPVERWPAALRTAVRLMLGSPIPTSLWVGAEYTLLYNDAYVRLLGPHHPGALGAPGAGTWRTGERDELQRRFDSVRSGGPSIHADAARTLASHEPGGAMREAWLTCSLSALTDENGRYLAVYEVVVDVTTRVLAARADADAARAEAETARRTAETANRTKSEFLATMSHELRTPLNAVLGYAQLLGMGVLGPSTPAQHAHLERLEASARHLLQLVDDVLDVAKVDADRLDVRRDALVTGAAVVAAVSLVQPQATAKGVRLVDLGSGTPGVSFIGDEHRVRQVLVNLVSNAVKFTPPGGQVSVYCGQTDEPEPGVWRPVAGRESLGVMPTAWAFIRVEDTGPGISGDVLNHLFEPFVQGDSALTREQGGTGLGLAISRRLARLMNGDITARSRAGSGAVFTLWLPAAQPDATDSPAPGTVERSSNAPRLGVAPIGNPASMPLDDRAYAILHALGVRLATDAEIIAERYCRLLRADGRFPGAHELSDAQLRDHATPTVGLLASQLMIIGETRGEAAELLADGAQVQRVMAELHGAQRYRLGWSETDIERETPLLYAEVERVLRGALESAPAEVALDVKREESGGLSEQSIQTAARYAADVSRHVFEQSARTAARAFRFARAADTP